MLIHLEKDVITIWHREQYKEMFRMNVRLNIRVMVQDEILKVYSQQKKIKDPLIVIETVLASLKQKETMSCERERWDDGREEYIQNHDNTLCEIKELSIEELKYIIMRELVYLESKGVLNDRKGIITGVNKNFLPDKDDPDRSVEGKKCPRLRCPYIEEPYIMKMMMAPTRPDDSRKEACTDLRAFTKGSKELLIIDPYFYKARAKDEYSETVDEIKELLNLPNKKLEKIVIVSDFISDSGGFKTNNYDPDMRNAFTTMLRTENIEFEEYQYGKLHDRIWIADGNKGVMLGQSFNGLGKKLGLILDIPTFELKKVKEFCEENILLTQNTRKSYTKRFATLN